MMGWDLPFVPFPLRFFSLPRFGRSVGGTTWFARSLARSIVRSTWVFSIFPRDESLGREIGDGKHPSSHPTLKSEI